MYTPLHLFLTLLLSTSLHPPTTAKCFKYGPAFTQENRAWAHDRVDNFRFWSGNWYEGREKRRVCRDAPDGTSWTFEVKNIGVYGTNYLHPEECKNGLRKEVNGCEWGGKTGYWNWRYT